jgi:hypothetical protein
MVCNLKEPFKLSRGYLNREPEHKARLGSWISEINLRSVRGIPTKICAALVASERDKILGVGAGTKQSCRENVQRARSNKQRDQTNIVELDELISLSLHVVIK